MKTVFRGLLIAIGALLLVASIAMFVDGVRESLRWDDPSVETVMQQQAVLLRGATRLLMSLILGIWALIVAVALRRVD